jgi:ribosomal protein L12E/L44/L45/RPP1/RPP2
MSATDSTKLTEEQRATLVYSYAVLALNDGKLPITQENLDKVVTATGNKANKTFSAAFAKGLTGRDVSNYFSVGGGSGSAAPATGGAAPAKEAAKAPAKEDKKGNL